MFYKNDTIWVCWFYLLLHTNSFLKLGKISLFLRIFQGKSCTFHIRKSRKSRGFIFPKMLWTLSKYKMMFILCSHYTGLLLLHYTTWPTTCLMMGTEIIYQETRLSDFTIKTLKRFLKTMRKKKNFQKIYKMLFYDISIHQRTPFCKII